MTLNRIELIRMDGNWSGPVRADTHKENLPSPIILAAASSLSDLRLRSVEALPNGLKDS